LTRGFEGQHTCILKSPKIKILSKEGTIPDKSSENRLENKGEQQTHCLLVVETQTLKSDAKCTAKDLQPL